MTLSRKDIKNKALATGALAAVSFSLFGGVAGAQATVTVIGEGSSEELVAPPSPSCSESQLTLIPEASFTTVGVPIDVPRLGVGAGLETAYAIPDFEELGPGVIDIVEIITFDAHTGRSGWPAQDNESVAIEFLLDGEVQATTQFTPDVEDGENAAWVVSSLGEYELPDGADEARVVHFNEADNTDSVVAASLCAEFSEDATLAVDDAEAEDADDAEAGDEDEDDSEGPFTLEELLAQNAEADAEGINGSELAATGANEIAFAVIALGVIMVGVASKVQGQDPEELIY